MSYRVTNTGNSLIKEQFLRFAFPERATVLEAYLEPVPEPELGVTEVTDEDKASVECRWKIQHLEVGQSVGFRFVSDGGDWGAWTGVYPFNAEGGVDFQRRDVARVKADQEHVRPFLVYLILSMIAPAVLSASLGPALDVVKIAVALALVGLLLPHLRPVARLVERMVAMLFDRPEVFQSANTVRGDVGGQLVRVRTINGDVKFSSLEEKGRVKKPGQSNGHQ